MNKTAEEQHNIFASSDTWQQFSALGQVEAPWSSLFAPPQSNISLIEFDVSLAPTHNHEYELQLPTLEALEHSSLPELESLDASTVPVGNPIWEPEENIWDAVVELSPSSDRVPFRTWEAFEDLPYTETRSPYITEHGSEVFDAALASGDSKAGAGIVVRGNVLMQSLWNLGLGRSSQLFQVDGKSKAFKPLIPQARASGVSLRAAHSLIAQFMHTGNTLLFLRSFVERTFTSATSIPAKAALATVVANVLSCLEDELGSRSAVVASLVQLQRLFAKPREILLFTARLVDATKHAKNNEQLASILHHRLLELEEDNANFRRFLGEILAQVSKPALELLGEWIGIRREEYAPFVWERNSIVVVAEASGEGKALEYAFRSEMMPTFFSPEDGNTIFETGTSLRFLKAQHPEHPLARMDLNVLRPPNMEWGFGWQEIAAIASKAKAYQQRLQQTLLEFSKNTVSVIETATITSTSSLKAVAQAPVPGSEGHFQNFVQIFEALPAYSSHAVPDKIRLSLDSILRGSSEAAFDEPEAFPPSHSLVSELSFRPLIHAQAKVVNGAALRLFYRSHQLRLHLSLQHQFYLFGNGVFSLLLTTSLFDPERESAERRKSKMRSGVHMGLQLGSRVSWPPASSELRLALQDVLSESYHTSTLHHSVSNTRHSCPASSALCGRGTDDLPGQLNFAIRPLSEVEQQKMMDPDTLSALDFLCLSCVPPAPLHLVMTSVGLEKYDVIFRFLLRLRRMSFVVSRLPRQYNDLASRRFRLEAYHFVTVLESHIFQSGIAEHWRDFDRYVSDIEARLDDEDATAEIGIRVSEGLGSLRAKHEQCLDDIMFSLLLRKRQRRVLTLVNEIFECILLFAKRQKRSSAHVEQADGGGGGGGDDDGSLYGILRGKIRVFLSVCRGLVGKKGYGSGKDMTGGGGGGGGGEGDLMERLVVAMEMNTYFTGP